VNTGKFVGSGGNLEETVTKNNLEAAEEIVRQLRLRDIGGIIVVDFIDMVLESNRDLVLRRLVECLSRDRTKHQVAEVTSLGLVQMTRKKLGLGLLESFSEPCEVCAGRGVIVHHEPVTKHRSEGSSRGSKRGKGSQSQSQSQQHQHDSKSQAHAITDGAKNMLAQVAASTIQGSKPEERSEGHGPEPRDSRDSRGGSSSRDEKVSGKVSSRPSREPAATRGRAPEPQAPASGTLLDSVLDALPEAPSAGTGRARSRRVSTAPLRGGAERPATATSDDDAKSAQQALAEALDATARRKDAGQE
jgi:ribonuclease E